MIGYVNLESPGPGNYENNKGLGTYSKGFTISGKKEEKPNNNPGPG